MAGDPAQHDVLRAVGAGHRHRGGVDTHGRGREGDRDAAGCPGRQAATRRVHGEHTLPTGLGRRDVHRLAGSPQLHGRSVGRPGQDRHVHAVGVDPHGQQRDLLGPGEVRGVHGVTTDEDLGGRRAVADPHEGGGGVGPEDDVPVAPATAATGGRAIEVGASRAVVVHPHRQGVAERRRRGPRAPPGGAVGREAGVGVGVGAGLGVRVEGGGEPLDGGEAPVDPLQVGQDEELLRRRQRRVVAGQAHGAQAFRLAVAVNERQPAGAVQVRHRQAAAGTRIPRWGVDVAARVLRGDDPGSACGMRGNREKQGHGGEDDARRGLPDN